MTHTPARSALRWTCCILVGLFRASEAQSERDGLVSRIKYSIRQDPRKPPKMYHPGLTRFTRIFFASRRLTLPGFRHIERSQVKIYLDLTYTYKKKCHKNAEKSYFRPGPLESHQISPRIMTYTFIDPREIPGFDIYISSKMTPNLPGLAHT
jgi:hypothetical protein